MKTLLAAAAVAGLAASTVSAQVRDMQFDVNSVVFQAYAGSNGTGGAVPFGGLTHTGSLVLSDQAGLSVLNDIAIRTGGPSNPFLPQSFSGSLTDASVVINLTNGNVTGGTLMLQVGGAGGDTYSTLIGAAGNVSTYVGGGFKIEGLTHNGTVTDANFAGVAIADFFAQSGNLNGSFLNFRIQPDAQGAGNADIDVFVTVPAPGSLALLGLGSAAALRRRRR
jgi:hypothetical protein